MTTPAAHDRATMAPLQDFVDHFSRENPFFANRVSDPAGGELDVASIHDRAFHELVGYAEQAHREQTGIGVVVWGEAGIGKSHMLARLCRWSERDNAASCVFLHNIQASPSRLPRYVLKCAVSRLTCGRARQFYDTPLCRFIEQTIPDPLPLTGELPSQADARAALFRFTERLIGNHPHAGADAYRVAEILFRFYLSAYCGKRNAGGERSASLAAGWLAGDELAPDEAAKLGIAAVESSALVDNQAIDSALVALGELAWHGGLPLVLAFDQVDNLLRGQMEALTHFLHTLIDHARNLLVVTSGVQSKLMEFLDEGTILRAAWERIAQDELRLQRIGVEQARQLLEARLEQFIDPFVTVAKIKEQLQDDSLFPLGRNWLNRRMAGLVEIRPRDALNWARQRWRQQQERLRELGSAVWLANWSKVDGGSEPAPAGVVSPDGDDLLQSVDLRVSERIEDQITQRDRDPSGLPPDTDNLAGLVQLLLNQCVGRRGYAIQDLQSAEPTRARRQPTCHMLIRNRGDQIESRTAVTYVATTNPSATALALRRMLDDPELPDRILLVSEERLPLNLGAKGREYFEQLESRGPGRFEHVQLTFREYAELDALQAAVGDARSGDLEVELPGGRSLRLGEEEVIESLHRQDRYRRHRLLGKLLVEQRSSAGRGGSEDSAG